MKKLYIYIVLSLFIASPLYAQKVDERSEVRHRTDTSDIVGEHGVGWVRSHILDNWFFNVEGGGNLYWGHQDFLGPLQDHFAPQFEVHVGRWVFPMTAIRLGGGFGSSHGFIERNEWNTYHPNLGYGESGFTSDPSHTPLAGYFWEYDADNSLYFQKWNYVYGGFDVLINLTNLKDYYSYRENHRWNNIFYAGAQFKLGLNEDHWNYDHTVIDVPRSSDANNAAEAHVGYLGQLRLVNNLCAFIDLRASIVEGKFDREFHEDMESFPQDFSLNALVGLTYDFHLRNEVKRRKYYEDHGLVEAGSTGDLPKFVHFVQVEEIEQVTIIDTIIKYKTIVHDDIRTKMLVDSLQDVLDSIVYHQKNRANDQPLDSIFLKQLLPYEMVFFELDKWDILSSEEMKIAKMAKIIKAYPNEKFLLTGSADSQTGTVKRNIFLSHNRADVVYNRLITEYDVNPDQLIREYLGGILDYEPFQLNRATVIIMDHPTVRKAFEAMKSKKQAGGGVVDFEN